MYFNYFTNTKNKIDSDYRTIFKRYLIRIYNLRISYPNKEILFFDNSVSEAFRYMKYYPDAIAAYFFVIGNNLCIPLGGIFSSNTIGYR